MPSNVVVRVKARLSGGPGGAACDRPGARAPGRLPRRGRGRRRACRGRSNAARAGPDRPAVHHHRPRGVDGPRPGGAHREGG
ncbi:hypothetical protein [Nocardioides convexus]|uniref:hypothetical protein n=1 Tax=Nocardioides convexus TaxID=2712224 RepID=UPI0024182D1E|nr:hypothetical protein [Nocardioides convexus]